MSDGKKLVACILESGSVESLRMIQDDLFEDDELILFRGVRDHFRRYQTLPSVRTVEEEFRVRLPRVEEPIAFYLKKVYDRKLFVSIREEYGNLRDSLQTQDVDEARLVIDRMKSACRIATPDDDVRNAQEAGRLVLQQYDIAHSTPGMSGILTGIDGFDRVTGGYQNGDLVSWIARMGVGKTYIILAQALTAWKAGRSVLVVTMEMTIPQIMRRVIGLDAGINPDYIRKGVMDEWGMRRLRRYVQTMYNSDRFHIFAGSFHKRVSDVEILIHELAPDIVFIDGAYLLQPDIGGKGAPRIEKVATVYDEIKKLTITCDRPLVTTSQFARSAGKRGKDGSMETISFSDAIGMHSSIVCSIKEGKPPFEVSRREIEIMKGREGESGSFTTNYSFNPMNFSEVNPEQQQAEAVDVDWMG